MSFPFALIALALTRAPEPSTPPSTDAAATVAIDQVAVVVDHSALLDRQMAAAADKSKRFVLEDVSAALTKRHGMEVIEGSDAPAVVVTLSWKDYENSVYRIEIATRPPGQSLQVVEMFEAHCINNSALSKAVLDKLPSAVEQLDQTPEPAVVPTVAEPPAPQSTTPPVEPTTAPTERNEEPKAKALGPVGVVGIVAGVTGLGMTGVGFGLAARKTTQAIDPMREQEEIERSPSRSAYAWVGVGLGLTAVGVTMLVVDLTALRKRRQRALAVSPSLGPTAAGLELRVSF